MWFKSCLENIDSDSHDAFCKFCQKILPIAGQGVNQIESYLKVEKHTLKRALTSLKDNEKHILTFP